MFEAFVQALGQLADPIVFLAILAGTVISITIGIIPGISAVIGMVLFLPFVFGMDPKISLPFLATFGAVAVTGGSITAVLLGVPGVPSSAATLLDGFPMTQRGEGARGVGAALTASMVGGAGAVIYAFLMIPVLIPLVLHFRSPEMFFLIIMGLCFLAVLTKESKIKGLISAGVGMLIAMIGFQEKTAMSRFTFGNLYLYDGISVIVMVLAFFALPVLANLVISGKPISSLKIPSSRATYRQLLKGALDVFRHWWLFLRCTIIGYIVGVIPGIGGETAIWVSYGYAKQVSKNPHEFGTGRVEGVIAPESANNSKDAGAMLTTLVFGVPGSVSMVIMLAALLMVGIQPGPGMLTGHTDITFLILLTIAASNILAGILCFGGIPYLARVTRVSPEYLFCIILPLIYIGTYTFKGVFLDLTMLLPIAVLSLLLRRFGYPLPPLILGFILGGLAEYYLWHSLDAFGATFFLSPISLGLIFFTILLVGQDALKRPLQRLFTLFRRAGRKPLGELATVGGTTYSGVPLPQTQVSGTATPSEAQVTKEPKAKGIIKMKPGTYFLIGIIAVMLFFGIYALTYDSIKTKLLPLLICGITFVLAAIELGRELLTARESRVAIVPEVEDSQTGGVARWKKYAPVIAWMAGYLVAIYLFGFLMSTPLFMLAYLKFQSRHGWLRSAAVTAAASTSLYLLFVVALQTRLFSGLIFRTFF